MSNDYLSPSRCARFLTNINFTSLTRVLLVFSFLFSSSTFLVSKHSPEHDWNPACPRQINAHLIIFFNWKISQTCYIVSDLVTEKMCVSILIITLLLQLIQSLTKNIYIKDTILIQHIVKMLSKGTCISVVFYVNMPSYKSTDFPWIMEENHFHRRSPIKKCLTPSLWWE